jgi:hypothetical protein
VESNWSIRSGIGCKAVADCDDPAGHLTWHELAFSQGDLVSGIIAAEAKRMRWGEGAFEWVTGSGGGMGPGQMYKPAHKDSEMIDVANYINEVFKSR